MAKRIFTMNGKKYESMAAIAEVLGISRLRPRDFDKYGVKEITNEENAIEAAATEEVQDEVSSSEETSGDVTEETSSESEATSEVTDETDASEETEDTKEDSNEKTSSDEEKDSKKEDKPAKKKSYTIAELVKMPLSDYSKYLRKVETNELIAFAEDNKLETFDDMEDERIRRMKVAMTIKAKFFPGQALPVKKPSFKGVDVEQLTAFADKNNIEYKKSSEPKIQKMWVIYALNQAGYTELPQVAEDTKENA